MGNGKSIGSFRCNLVQGSMTSSQCLPLLCFLLLLLPSACLPFSLGRWLQCLSEPVYSGQRVQRRESGFQHSWHRLSRLKWAICPSCSNHCGQRGEACGSGYLSLRSKSLQNLGTETTIISLSLLVSVGRNLGTLNWVTLAWGPSRICSQMVLGAETRGGVDGTGSWLHLSLMQSWSFFT